MPTCPFDAIDCRDAVYAFVSLDALRASLSAPTTILDAGEQRRSQAESSDVDKGSPVRDELLAKLVSALESRLKKSKLALIQIFVVMLSTETEAAAIISTLQEMKFGMEALCNSSDIVEVREKEKTRRATRAQA